MFSFDFHHHNKSSVSGIYNAEPYERPSSGIFSAGIHPNQVSDHNDGTMKWLYETADNKNCVAIGECGLDGLLATDFHQQKEIFHRQILLANELNKPVIIHCVRRFYELIPFKKIAKTPLIIHGFNKKEQLAKDMLKHDFYLSFGKSVLHNLSLQKLLQHFPVNKMFLETDGKDFEIELLYRKTAALKNMEQEELYEQMLTNLSNIGISVPERKTLI